MNTVFYIQLAPGPRAQKIRHEIWRAVEEMRKFPQPEKDVAHVERRLSLSLDGAVAFSHEKSYRLGWTSKQLSLGKPEATIWVLAEGTLSNIHSFPVTPSLSEEGSGAYGFGSYYGTDDDSIRGAIQAIVDYDAAWEVMSR